MKTYLVTLGHAYPHTTGSMAILILQEDWDFLFDLYYKYFVLVNASSTQEARAIVTNCNEWPEYCWEVPHSLRGNWLSVERQLENIKGGEE